MARNSVTRIGKSESHMWSNHTPHASEEENLGEQKRKKTINKICNKTSWIAVIITFVLFFFSSLLCLAGLIWIIQARALGMCFYGWQMLCCESHALDGIKFSAEANENCDVIQTCNKKKKQKTCPFHGIKKCMHSDIRLYNGHWEFGWSHNNDCLPCKHCDLIIYT